MRTQQQARRCFSALALFSMSFYGATPPGWILAGDKPSSYECDIDSQTVNNGHPSAYLKSKEEKIDGFGTMMQSLRADQYRGKRIRFRALVKSNGVNEWAGLWLRVDKGSRPVAFDNMQERPIKGTSDWKSYQVVLEVPKEATGIAFGILLAGTGTVWINSAEFEAVDESVPLTGNTTQHDAPTNLSFDK